MARNDPFALLESAVKVVTNTLMAGNLVLILASVFFRYVLGAPLVWSEELAKFILVWTVFLAAGNSIRHWDNLAGTFLVEKLPAGAARVVDAAIRLIAFAFVIFLFVLAMRSIPNVWHRELAPALGITMVVPQLGVIVGLFLMIVQFAGMFVSLVRAAKSSPRSDS